MYGTGYHLPPPAAQAVELKDKRIIGVVPTRDGRWHVQLQVASTMTAGKLAFSALLLLGACWVVLGPLLGLSGGSREMEMRRRVADLEGAMGKRLTWLAQHRGHLGSHLSSGGNGQWAPKVHADGRKHLVSDPDGISRIAEAAAPHTALPPVDDHYLCGENPEVTEAEVMRKKLAMVVVTWNAPLSLRNSMNSWARGGLLDLMDEKMIFIQRSPSFDEDMAIAKEFDFDVYLTDENNGNVMAGPAVAYLCGNTTADYVLFMEKDFVLSADRATTIRELWHGMFMVARGVDVYRLRGATDYPAEGMPDCCAKTDPPQCPYHNNWHHGGDFSAHMNWLKLWCDPDPLASANGRAAECTQEPAAPRTFCFGSGDTNWSNNPLIMPARWFNERVRHVALFGEKAYTQNNMFEFNVMMDWLAWRPPAKVCISWGGIFTHHEIDQ